MKSPLKCSSPRVICNPYIKDLVLSNKCVVEKGVVTVFSFSQIHEMSMHWPYARFSPDRVDLFEVNDYYVVNQFTGEVFPMYYVVPCGKCMICREQKVKDWCFRVHCESAVSSTVPLFVTPSYNDASLPSDGVSKRHIQLFMKRLRMMLIRMGFDVAKSLRYFCVSEYGAPEHTFRPHYHIMFWNFPYLDDNLFINMVMVQEVLEKAWSYGFVKVQPLLKGGAAYVMKYMRKDGKVPPGQNKPFYMCSRREGIGYQKCDELRDWCIDNPSELTVSVTDPYTGLTCTTSLPIYFKNRIFPSVCKMVPKDIRDAFDGICEAYHFFQVYSKFHADLLSGYFQEAVSRYEFLPRKYFTARLDNQVSQDGMPKRKLQSISEMLLRYEAKFENCYLNLMSYDVCEDVILEVLNARELRRHFCLMRPLRCFDTDGLEYDIIRKREEARRRIKL